MEEKIQVIKKNLTGDVEKDVSFLDALYDEQNAIIEDANTTIEAINIVFEEIKKEEENKKTNKAKNEEIIENNTSEEIDNMINELLDHIDEESAEEALDNIEELIPKIESLTKSEDGILYCSFKSEFEKKLFERIFAGEKQVIATPYANDSIYIIYADLLLGKKRYTQALEALDRAIYWNFLNREAREKKLNIYFERNEIVKCLETLKLLQMISYTAVDIASCYNKYGYIFNHLKDNRAAYSMYRLSYDFYQDEKTANTITALEEMDPTLKEMSDEEIFNLAEDNEVVIGANGNVIKAQRSLITDLMNDGFIEEAKIMLENDYAMTRDEAIADVYNQLVEINQKNEEVVEKEDQIVENTEVTEEDVAEESEVKEEKQKKKRTTTKKTAATKTKTKKEDKKEE